MKRKSTILLISGVAISAHLRLSATEGQERENETPQEIASEILTGQPAHSVQDEKNEGTNSTSNITTPAGNSHSESEESLEE